MARGKNDLILRDRLQFTLDASGDLPIVYGRVDLSDYVSVVNNQGLAIKETRIMLRNPNSTNTGFLGLNLALLGGGAGQGVYSSDISVVGTTTAYENGADIGIASPNTFFQARMSSENSENAGGDVIAQDNVWFEFGTPDLHPEGYVVVSDVLIGISANNATRYADDTLECDVMLIAEPVKVTKDELKEMLAQATDL